jgi:signal transduction histidine kinase
VHALGLYADWLGSEPELVHELAPKIVESTKAVNQLFDSLFDLARLDSGKIKLNIETVDVAKLLHDLELQYRPLCEAKGLQFRVHVRPGTAVSDPILLQRIVGNLISNAVKYTSAAASWWPRAQPRGPAHRDLGHRRGHRAGAPARDLPEFYKVPTTPAPRTASGWACTSWRASRTSWATR